MAAASPAARAAALALLGLPEGASPQEVTRAYRSLVKVTHPDVTGRSDPDAGRRFAALTEAYRLLTSTDRTLPAGPDRPKGSAHPTSPASKVTVRVRHASPPGVPPPIIAGPVTITPSPAKDAGGGPRWAK